MLRLRHLSLTGTVLLAILPAIHGSPAQAAESNIVQYGQSGWWTVSYDTKYNTCLMRADFDNGLRVAWAFGERDDDGRELHLIFGNPGWTTVRDGATYTGSLQFNDGAWGYQGSLTGGTSSDATTQFLITSNLKTEVAKSFMRADSLTLLVNGKSMGKYSLAGSFAAMGMMAECQIAADKAGHPEARKPAPTAPAQPPTYSM